MNKVGPGDNLADALAKGVSATEIQKHLIGAWTQLPSDRRRIAPALDEKTEAEKKVEDELKSSNTGGTLVAIGLGGELHNPCDIS